uniref:Uncharacterized protein n=1 Tax=viral metagenome TaxID=1070528 RepID=A0A6C0D8P6_9ZZZZ
MNSFLQNVLSTEDINYLKQLPEVLEAKTKLDSYTSYGKVYFSVVLTDSIRIALETHFGLNLSNVNTIPMRWIKGDTLPHIDTGISKFERTHLVYLNNCPGEFLVDNKEYPILENTGYVFNEGISHETLNTELVPRLMIGPMSEQAFAVGSNRVSYYPSLVDALNNTNLLGELVTSYPIPFIVGDVDSGTNGGYTRWMIASASGSSNPSIVYNNGDTLINDGVYNLYPSSAPCFLEGTHILCQENGEDTYLPIEKMRPGTLVKTSLDGYKKVDMIGKRPIHNTGTDERSQTRIYKCSPTNYPELNGDLFITGGHSILVDVLSDKEREETIKQIGKIYVTSDKYRLIAAIDERTEPWKSEGTYNIWHIALENDDYFSNYGIYANGLLVESCSKRYLKELSNMTIIE